MKTRLHILAELHLNAVREGTSHPKAMEAFLMDVVEHLAGGEAPPSVQKEPEPHSYALLKLEGAAKPLYFVMEERYGKPDEEDYQGHRQYFYESHSCPTNWLGDCVAVIEAGDTDPHGFLTFVRSVPIDPNGELDINSEPLWEEIFPEAFDSGGYVPHESKKAE